MRFDTEEIRNKVDVQKQKFKTRIVIAALVFVAATTVGILSLPSNKPLAFTMFVILFPVLIYAYYLFLKYSPSVLFSKDIVGVNVMEADSVSVRPGRRVHPHASLLGRENSRASGAGWALGAASSRLRSEVYVRTDDGDIRVLRGLAPAHLEIYEDGDTLMRIAGTRYPVITGRETKVQPCPICGRILKNDNISCPECKISIYDK